MKVLLINGSPRAKGNTAYVHVSDDGQGHMGFCARGIVANYSIIAIDFNDRTDHNKAPF